MKKFNLKYYSFCQAAQVVVLAFFCMLYSASAARIKDIATIEGASGVQVIGYGLVTGLNNTGDNQRSTFTVQSVSNMLKRFGLTIPQTDPRIRNVAAVMVTTTIPTFMRIGSKVDVQVSSIGDAKSLQGGILLMTPISTADGNIIGMAQGAVSVGGYQFESLGSVVGRNFVTSGRVPSGLILDKSMEGKYIENQQIRIALRDPDFTNANLIANAINTLPGLANAAVPQDAASVLVQLPAGQNQAQIMQTIAQIETQPVTTSPTSRVVINERTGTVVVGGSVELLPAVVSHGGLEIMIQRQVVVVQPAPFTIIPPTPAQSATITTQEDIMPPTPLEVMNPTVQDMAAALNLLKVKPRDLIAIFQALKESGSLQGELIIQ